MLPPPRERSLGGQALREGQGFLRRGAGDLPQTIAFVERLPFHEIGRCVIFGLEPNDHAPLHRDTAPGRALGIAQSISFDPRRTKRFFLCNEEEGRRTEVDAPIYWFNDMDYHGVEPDPFFRYSIRVDGVFEPAFAKRLCRDHRG